MKWAGRGCCVHAMLVCNNHSCQAALPLLLDLGGSAHHHTLCHLRICVWGGDAQAEARAEVMTACG